MTVVQTSFDRRAFSSLFQHRCCFWWVSACVLFVPNSVCWRLCKPFLVCLLTAKSWTFNSYFKFFSNSLKHGLLSSIASFNPSSLTSSSLRQNESHLQYYVFFSTFTIIQLSLLLLLLLFSSFVSWHIPPAFTLGSCRTPLPSLCLSLSQHSSFSCMPSLCFTIIQSLPARSSSHPEANPPAEFTRCSPWCQW